MRWPRVRRLGLRLVVAVLGSTAVCYLSVRAYVEYELHRATSMLAEAASVQIDTAEATVLPLVGRYGGSKWTPEPLSPKENWIDKDEYEYQKNLVSDYRYDLEVSPFGLLTTNGRFGADRTTQALRAAMSIVPAHLRVILGMRDWGTEVGLSIRSGRVQCVSGMALVEGRSRWLGHEWRFANAMPNHELQAKAFVIDSAILEMANNNGMLIQNLLTPRASDEEVRAARKFSAACLTSITGCEGFCEFAPSALEYLNQHSDAAGNIITPKCP